MKKIINLIRSDGYRFGFDTLVVIVGVLIAFSLNSWNEKRNRQNQVRAYAVSLISDLKGDIKNVNQISSQIKESIIRIDSLANYTRNKQISELSNLTLFPLTMGDYMYKPYAWNRTTIEDLKISGTLRFKGNEELSEKISSYDALTNHLVEDYYQDVGIKDRVSKLAASIVNQNYSNFDELSWYGNTNNHILTYNFSSSEPYHRAEKDNLKLLTNDINDVHNLVNGYLNLKTFLKIRNKYELPRLIEKAEGIIDLLEKKYVH